MKKIDSLTGFDIACAYKKLKSSAYFDKTRTHLAKRVVEFENALSKDALVQDETIDDPLYGYLRNDIRFLLEGSDSEWEKGVDEICDTIQVKVFPKSTATRYPIKNDNVTLMNDDADEPSFPLDHEQGCFAASPLAQEGPNGSIIRLTTAASKKPHITKTQSFIDMDIKGFILGILWCCSVGVKLDSCFGRHIYGNRIRKVIHDHPDSAWTMSPYLFEPYFSQYESWRDEPIRIAERITDEDKDDALIIMTDIKSFYYSLDFTKDCWNALESELHNRGLELGRIELRLNRFVGKVIECYSALFVDPQDPAASKMMLPIGFDPSGILANWYLHKFDNEIINKLNPAFYGRYVDDIVLVERVRDASDLKVVINEEGLSTEEIIDHVFGLENVGSRFCANKDSINTERAGSDILKKDPADQEHHGSESYKIHERFFHGSSPDLVLQCAKTNAIIVEKNAQRSLLEHFKKTIAKNSSEFRLMPDLGDLTIGDSFLDLFDLDCNVSPTKLRDLKELKLDKYELSKYLGKCQRIFPLVQERDTKNLREQIVELYSYADLIELYSTWEKLLQITLYCNDTASALSLCKKMLDAIHALRVTPVSDDPRAFDSSNLDQSIEDSLIKHFISCLTRTVALCNDRKARSFVAKLKELGLEGHHPIDEFDILKNRRAYLRSCMVDKYAMPIAPSLINSVIPSFEHHSVDSDEDGDLLTFDLFDLQQIIRGLAAITSDHDTSGIGASMTSGELLLSDEACILPYILKIQDIQFGLYCMHIALDLPFEDSESHNAAVNAWYAAANYPQWNDDPKKRCFDAENHCECIRFTDNDAQRLTTSSLDHYCIHIKRDTISRHKMMQVAIGNIGLSDDTLHDALKGKRAQYAEFRSLVELLNTAKHERADLIVLPELSVPLEWLPRLQAFSAAQDIAIVCGLRYVRSGSQKSSVHNLTACILPYTLEGYAGIYKYANVHLHEKVFYPPKEASLIQNYGCTAIQGTEFELYVWKDLWFSLYCCFEIASPIERISFSAFSDLTVITEWNADTNFYDKLISALSRDLSCYCVQANNAVYGDSRIEQPKKTAEKTILQVSGGNNWSILVGTIDIDAIRDCQILIDSGNGFKPPAPDFNHEIADMKRRGVLLDHLRSKSKGSSKADSL